MTSEMGGEIIDLETNADFVILARRVYQRLDESVPHRILLLVKSNLMPIEQQIHALEQAGHILVHGDQPGHHGEGYSLHRTILSHGTELDPSSEHYFELD